MKLLSRVLFLFLTFYITGCGGDPRLIGTWKFDKQQTEAQLQPVPSAQIDSTFEGMKQQLAASLIPALISKLEGVKLTFTSRKMIMMTNDGSGQAMSYEILEQPTADSWQIKTSDGKVTTYYREGDWLVSDASGDIRMRVYFARISK